MISRGSRVRVTGGRKSLGVTGTVFWTGANKWDGKERLGIEGDDGETHWVAAHHVEATDDAPPEIELPAPGARVRFALEGVEVEGTVFWVGPAKSGRGHRIGVKDPAGGAHWLDARKLSPVAADGPAWNEEEPPF